MIQRAVILAALLFFPTAAHATGPACCGGGGSSISANSCSVPGDFATGIAADGTLTCSTPSGGGNVSNTGTPVDNQLAIWTAATTIEGDSALTFDTSTNTLTTTTFSGALSGNATTATALASNPSDCASDTYATTIAASGNLTCASITNASTTGTATNTPSTLVLRDGSGNFAAGTITAALTGNASTATALAANPADCSADTYATTIAASGALTCSTVTNAGLAGSIAVSKTLLSAGFGLDLSGNSLLVNGAEWTGPQVWGDGSGTMSWTFNTGITDPIIDFYNTGVVDVTGTLQVGGVAVLTDGTGTVDATNLAADSVSADELNATGVEAELEAVMDLQDMQGAVTDAQVPDTITASNYLPLAGGTLTGNLVLSGDAGEGVSGGGLSDCDNATTSKLLWDSTTNKFSCGTDQGGSGSGISGIAADSGGTTTGSTVTITGTGTDTTRSTDTISVDVDMTEVSLTKGSIWQGNSSSLATAYSNPSGIDIRTYGAACDGSQDDSQEIQNLIDDLTTSGGTILIPNTGSPCMVSTETANDYIQMKSNVNIVCAPGAEIKASSATPPLALIKATGTGASSVNNWRISGCYFNLDQQKISAVYIEEGSNFSFDHNSADFNGDGDATSTNTTAFDIVHLDCKATEYGPSASPPYEGAPCTITHNSVRGSEVDAQNDTCFSVFGSGGLLGLGHGAMFANNFAQFCGGACLNAFEALTISANNLADCLDQGINSSDASNQLSSSAITGNVIQATGTEAGFYGVNVQNLQIVGNSFPILGTGRAIQLRTSAGATISGVNIANNYAANTIHLDAVGSCVGGANIGQDCDADADCPASTCGTYGQFNHDIIFNNILSSPPTATWAGIDIENAQGWITVIDNTDVGTSASTRSSVKFTSLDSVKKGGILVANNNLSPAGAGTGTCITFDHTAGGALEAVNVVGNLCGGVDSTGTTIASIDKGLEIVGSPTRTNFNMDGNNFGNTTTAYTGITDRNVVQQTTAPACVAAGTAANDTWHIEDFSYTNAVAGKPVFISVTVSFTDANTTIEDIEWFLYDNGASACPTDCTTTAPSGTALAPTGGIVTKSTAVAAQNQSTAFLWIDTVPIAGTNIYCLGLENATNATGDPTVGNVTFSAWQ